MAASDYVPISFKNRLHLAGRPQMSTRPKFRMMLHPKNGPSLSNRWILSSGRFDGRRNYNRFARQVPL